MNNNKKLNISLKNLIKKYKKSYWYDNLLKTDKNPINNKILNDLKTNKNKSNLSKKKKNNLNIKRKKKLTYNLYKNWNKKDNKNLSESKINFKFTCFNNIYNNDKKNTLNSLNSIKIKTIKRKKKFNNNKNSTKKNSKNSKEINSKIKKIYLNKSNSIKYTNKIIKENFDINSLTFKKTKYDNKFKIFNFFDVDKIDYYIEDLKFSLLNNKNDYFSYLRQFHLKQNFKLIKKYESLYNNIEINDIKIEIENSDNLPILFFDLDETLIHCNTKETHNNSETIYWNNKILYIYKRPFLKEFLENLIKNFILVLFTASKEEYAKVILKIIDPNDKYFRAKFFRKDCKFIDRGYYIKDWRIIKNINLKKCCIIDNWIFSFINQLLNGIPIIPFFGNLEDNELKKLLNYLNSLKNISDFTIINNLKFQFSNYLNYDNYDNLIKFMFIN